MFKRIKSELLDNKEKKKVTMYQPIINKKIDDSKKVPPKGGNIAQNK